MVTRTRVGRSFVFKSDTKLTESEAIKIQQDMGYHPCGYGFYKFDGYKWECMDSCD